MRRPLRLGTHRGMAVSADHRAGVRPFPPTAGKARGSALPPRTLRGRRQRRTGRRLLHCRECIVPRWWFPASDPNRSGGEALARRHAHMLSGGPNRRRRRTQQDRIPKMQAMLQARLLSSACFIGLLASAMGCADDHGSSGPSCSSLCGVHDETCPKGGEGCSSAGSQECLTTCTSRSSNRQAHVGTPSTRGCRARRMPTGAARARAASSRVCLLSRPRMPAWPARQEAEAVRVRLCASKRRRRLRVLVRTCRSPRSRCATT